MAQTDNTSKTLRIKNWGRFQHFKDRKPPWVKLYRDLLDDIEWHNLDADAAKTLVSLWLIASEDGGLLPPMREIAFRLRMPENRARSIVSKLDHWLEQSDVAVISPGYRSDSKETELETELETETETGNGASPRVSSERQRAFDNWNKIAEALNLSQAQMLTKDRQKKLDARLKEVGLKGWNAALNNLEEMPFCFGENDRGWKVTLDWMLSPTNLTKILEKHYAREEKRT